MKKLFLLLGFASALSLGAQTYPTLSPADGSDDHWYVVKFNSGNVLHDNGSGSKCTTATSSRTDANTWKLVGTSNNNVQLVSKLGNKAYMTNSRLYTSSTASQPSGWRLYYSNSNGAFEIHANNVSTTASGYCALNQWGSITVGQELGLWNANDVNDALSFVAIEDLPDYSELDKLIGKEYNTVNGATLWTPDHLHTLWYNKPGTKTNVNNVWMEYGLPIGNGQLGATLFGGVYCDQLQLNEKTIWSGTSTIKPNPQHGKFLNLGSLYVIDQSGDFSLTSTTPGVKSYKRWLDLEDGVGGVDFSGDKGAYTRRYFSSEPDKVIVAHYTAPEGHKLKFQVSYYAAESINATAPKYNGAEGSFIGHTDLIKYNTTFRVLTTGAAAKVTSNNLGVFVEDADEVTIVLTARTDYDGTNTTTFSSGVGDAGLASEVKGILDGAAGKGYDKLYADHVDNFRSYMDRCTLHLSTGTTDAKTTRTTNALVDFYNQSTSNATGYQGLFLEQLYFTYGRYLEISSSRGIDVPSNLQGIWNNSQSAPWNSDVHTNINVQMNYWPAETTNLSECHLPFLNYIVNMTKSPGWIQARTNAGQTVGWTVHTESNIFGGMSSWSSNYTIANAWYVSHLWQHYRYTLDKAYLAKVFPAMWSCAQYWAERLKLASDGTYVCPNEYSPEHGPQSEDGTAHSQQLVRELFENTLAAIDALGNESTLDQTWLNRIKSRYQKLDMGLKTETYSGNWGTSAIKSNSPILREWKYSNYTAGANGHRHLSHLMCLYPFSQVTPGTEYFQAAVNSLALRGDAATGWSMGWKVNLWARAQDGDHAHIILKNALKHAGSYGVDMNSGGIYYNLWDSHAPFQIDGNFGMTAGIAELLMQSCTDTISILPALPSVWKKGSIKGLKAVGDFTVSIDWEKNAPKLVTIVSNQGQPLFVKAGKKDLREILVTVDGAMVTPVLTKEGNYEIPNVGAGSKVEMNFSVDPTSVGGIKASALGKTAKAYDLQGRHANFKQKGVYVVNGKKILK